MKIPFYLGPIQKLQHFRILHVIQAIYGGSALYMVVMQRVGWFPGKSIIGLYDSIKFFSLLH